MKKQINSFKVSFSGLWYVIANESHMRFHIVAAIYVTVFGILFYDFSVSEWVGLIVLMVSVMAAEIINTSIERLCNFNTTEINSAIKIVKDTAAAAVLVLSLGALAVAFLLFWDIRIFKEILHFYCNNPIWSIVLILSGALSVLFVCRDFN